MNFGQMIQFNTRVKIHIFVITFYNNVLLGSIVFFHILSSRSSILIVYYQTSTIKLCIKNNKTSIIVCVL